MVDRDAAVAAIDLAELADELLGPPGTLSRSRSWRCPEPDHEQTGRTPPVTIFTSRRGEERWHSHGCGAGGTAVDIVMRVRGVDVRAALDELAQRARLRDDVRFGHADGDRPTGRSPWRWRTRPEQRPPSRSGAISEVTRFVTECSDALWQASRAAAGAREWLVEQRGLPPEVLRRNGVGFDAGPRRQWRPDGVPAMSPAVVLPALVAGGASYLQLRLLAPREGMPRYVNPRSELAVNPRLAKVRPVGEPAGGAVVVTEGLMDALCAAAAGFRAVAVLGAAAPDAVTAQRLARIPHPLVIAFDPDPAGERGAERLTLLLAELQRPGRVLRPPRGDLNESLLTSSDWQAEFSGLVARARLAGEAPPAARAL